MSLKPYFSESIAKKTSPKKLRLSGRWEQLQSKKERFRFFESRVMSVAQGVNPDHLRVMGWVEDAKGKVLAAAQSGCTPLAR